MMSLALSQKMQVFPEKHAALITLGKEELERFSYKKGDTESLVNMPLQIPDVQWSIFMREDDNFVKISARSQGEFAVNSICEKYFNGGGHKNAAGGEFYGTLDEAVATFNALLDSGDNDDKDNDKNNQTNDEKK